MRVLNIGSMNMDFVYRVPAIVRPGETIASASLGVFAGGKGANQSVAVARAGGHVSHVGRIGEDGRWLVEKLASAGVDVTGVRVGTERTGNAIIQVDDAGQNAIVLFAGANHGLRRDEVDAALAGLADGDVVLLQNEVNDVPWMMARAAERGLRVCWNPAPFTPEARRWPIDAVTTLVVNETEAMGLLGCSDDRNIADRLASRRPVMEIVVTLGEKGVSYRHGGERHDVPARRVVAVDTTGAGDCFLGYFLASRGAGLPVRESLERACHASAICVTRPGAMDSIPTAGELG